MKKYGIFICTLCLCLVLSACKHKAIDPDQIERIDLHTHTERAVLDTEDQDRFITLYNAATNGGRPNGEGCTPEYGFTVYFKGGDVLFVNEFCGRHDFETSRNYLNSDDLVSFAEEMLTKYCREAK